MDHLLRLAVVRKVNVGDQPLHNGVDGRILSIRYSRTTRHSSRRFLPSRLEVENDEVAPTHVKAGEVVQRVLGIVNVLVHDERGSARLLRITTTNIRTKADAHIRIWRMSPYFAKMSYSSSFVIL